MRVTSMEKARHGKRFVVFLDGEPWKTLEGSTLDALNIAVGADIDPDETEARAMPMEASAARERALTMLDYSNRTRREIEIDLQRRKYPVEAIDYALSAMEHHAFIDDERLARLAVDSAKGRASRRALRDKLRARGIGGETLDEVFADYDERDEMEAALREARRRMSGREPSPEICRKAVEALMRKGFSYAVAREAVRAVSQSEPSEYEDNPEDEWE